MWGVGGKLLGASERHRLEEVSLPLQFRVRRGVEGAHCGGWDLEGFSGRMRALEGARWKRAKHPGKDEVGALGYDCVVRLEYSGLGRAEPDERSDCVGPRLAHHRCF